MKKMRKMKSFLLIVSLVLAVMAPAQVFAAENGDSVAASNTKQLYTIGYTAYENGSGVKKGNTQDCQHLGVWIKKDTVLKVRQTNANFKQNLTLRLRNDDSKTENSVTIPANGSWASITARADGVPFVTSVYSSNGQRPVVEWKTEGGGELYNLPVYDYEYEERSEKAFYQMWNDTDAPFAVMECRRAILLVPKCDKTKNGFKSLDRLLEYYNEMVDQYNLFAGLVSKDSSVAQKRPWDVDSESRFFMKANANGVGLAYYGGGECGYNNKSMDGFLAYGWVLNHEVGHGYKTPAGIGTQDEIWNNVFGHYYQHTIENKSDWGGVDNDTKRKSYETGQPYPGGSSYGRSLYFWTNMFDKIGPQYTISNFYKQYRYDKYSPDSTVNPDTGWDYYSKSFTKISGYNVIPYFEKWGLYGQEASKNEIIEAGIYKNVYPLGQLSTKEETLAAVNKDLNLGSKYALVETQDLVRYGKFSGTAEFTFDDASFDLLSGKKITITDGVNTVKEVVIDSKTLDVTLPIGVYNVLLDKQADKIGINDSRGFLVIREGENKTYSVTVNQRYADSLANTVIRFNGLSFVNYFTATYDPAKMQVRMKTENKKPHSYFSEKDGTYSSITLYDDKGNVIYTKVHIGDIASPEDKTFYIQEGYRVKVYHNNDSKVQSRNQIVYSYGGNATPVALENTVTYEFTKKGLKRVVSSKPMTDAELNENYYKTLTAYFDSLIKKTDSASWKDGESLLEEKARISAAYEVLTAEQKNKFKTAYSAYFPFENTISTWEVGTILDQTYTGSAIVPDVTVRSSNGTILKKGTDYKVTFSNNENVGTAQAVVTGLGSYKNFVSKINFNIVLGNVDFTAAVDQKEYNYNGYKVTPSMTVKDNGRVLERNVDYKIIYKNNINVGTATATAKGIGNYEGFESQDTFTIKGYAPGIKITVAPKKAVYNGETITAAVTVYDATYPSSGTKTLKAGKDYTVAGNSATNAGTHTITVNGIGNYSGVAATGAFEIIEKGSMATPSTTKLSNYRFDLKGYNDYTYAKLYVDIEKGQFKLTEQKIKPHRGFKNGTVYSYVRICDSDGVQMFYKEQLGDQTLAGNTYTGDIGIGCVIELFHKEPNKDRAVIVPEYDYDNNNKDLTNRISVTDNVTKYIVTNTGINRIYPTDKKTDSQKAFYDSLVKYTDKYLAANYQGALYDNQDYVWDAVINKSLILLSDGNKASFTAKYNKKYKVTLDNKGGTSVTELVRDIRSGSKKTAVSVPEKTGYVFAGYYDAASGGTQYYNKDGNPTTETWNLTGNITLYAQWTAAAKETTPETVFSAETMKLTGVTSGMKYRIDDGEWIDVDGSDDITLNIFEACTISVVKKGNGTTTIDSAEQIITVTKAETPTLTAAQPEGIDGKGSIPTTEVHEFSEDGINYTECAGPTDDLEPGTYYVRVAASGTALASDAQEIIINAFVQGKETTPNAAFSAETMKLTGVTSGMKYRIDNGEWIDVDGSDDITLNISEACTISVVEKGNGTTTIDSAEQRITVTKAETPTLTAAQPGGIDGKGSIPTTEVHEFSEDGINYTECAGPTDDLEPGTYYVRVAASGTALASDAQEITISAFTTPDGPTPDEPTPDEPTPDEPTPDDNPTINNTVYFNANGGSVTPDSAETSEEGRLSILPTPTRNGYTFDGWYVEEAGGTEVTTDTVFDADTTIYAHWTANPVIDGGSAGGGGMIVAPIILPEQPSTEPTQSGNATTIDLSEDTVNKGGRTTTTVDKQVADKLVKVAVKNKSEEIVIIAVTKNKIKASNTKSSEVSLPAESLQTIAERTDANILIKTDVAEVKLDNKAVEAVASQIQAGTIGKDETVTIIAEKVKEESKEVRFEVKILTSKGICISDFNGGNAVVTVNVPKSFSNKETVCVYIDANGFMHKVDGGINADGTYSFTTGHFSTYSIMSEEEADAAIREQKEAVKVIKLKLRSELVKTKSGKKVIKLKWTNPSDIELEGVEIYRSLKKNSGYGRKPIYISKSGKYINTAVKTGKRYYYKVRGFVTIDGEKVYTEYSAKSYRTVK